MHGNSDRHHIVRVIAERGVDKAEKSLHGGAGSGQHDEGERDLRADQHVVRQCVHENHAYNFSRTGLHDLADFGARKLKRGPQPKRIPVRSAMATLKTRTGRLIWIAASWGKENLGSRRTITASAR